MARVGRIVDDLVAAFDPAPTPVAGLVPAAPGYGGDSMTQQPTVSVVVPTRDRPELLRAAVRAILAQDYPGPIEVVVVFDQSEPDESLTELATGPDRAVRVIRNDRTPGLAGARNSGILAAERRAGRVLRRRRRVAARQAGRPGRRAGRRPGAEFVCCGIRVSYDGHTVDRVLDKDRSPWTTCCATG